MSIQRRTACLLTGDAAGGPRKAPMEDPSLSMEEPVALSTGHSVPGVHLTSVLLHKNLLHLFLLLPTHQGEDVNFQDKAIYIYSFGKYLLDFCLFSLNYLSLGCEFFICSTYNYNVRYMYYNYFLLFHFINELLSMNLLFPSHFINGIFY